MNLADPAKYTEEMAKPVQEKLFFLDHIRPDILLDYGCADGAITEKIGRYVDRVIGYEPNSNLRPQVVRSPGNAQYRGDFEGALTDVHIYSEPSKETCMLFSSVLHEVINDGCWGEIAHNIGYLGPDYIVIRDMYISDADKNRRVPEEQIKQTLSQVNLRLVNSFTVEHGPIMSRGNFLHFLMKHRFAYNWEHENREDYLSITDDHLHSLRQLGNVIFEDHHALPYYQQVFPIRYDYELTTPTHIKMIIKRK